MFEEAEDDLKVLETTISDLEKSLADGNAEIVILIVIYHCIFLPIVLAHNDLRMPCLQELGKAFSTVAIQSGCRNCRWQRLQ